MVNCERKCCPYFTWALIFEPGNRTSHLQVYGSREIKEEMRLALKELELLK